MWTCECSNKLERKICCWFIVNVIELDFSAHLNEFDYYVGRLSITKENYLL